MLGEEDNQGYCLFGVMGSIRWQVFGYAGCITVNGRFELLLSISLILPSVTSLVEEIGLCCLDCEMSQ